MEVAVRGPAFVAGGRGGLKWSVLDAAGERGCKKVIRPLPGGIGQRLSLWWSVGRLASRGLGSGGPGKRRESCIVAPPVSLDLRSGKITR